MALNGHNKAICMLDNCCHQPTTSLLLFRLFHQRWILSPPSVGLGRAIKLENQKRNRHSNEN
jgi:hypothetical protein